MRQRIIIIAGPNGAGKTTLAREILRNQEIIVVQPFRLTAQVL